MGFQSSFSCRKRAAADSSSCDDFRKKSSWQKYQQHHQQPYVALFSHRLVRRPLLLGNPSLWQNFDLACRTTRYMRVYTSGSKYRQDELSNYVLVLPCANVEESASLERTQYFSRQFTDLASQLVHNPGRQATTLAELMAIRAVHGKMFRHLGLGTAVGFRTRNSELTDRPAIIVFVARKLHAQWVLDGHMLPAIVQGPGELWCDVDVVEFSYHGAPAPGPREQLYSDLVESLRGSEERIGPGSQVASLDVYGTMGAIVRSKVGRRQVGFLTNRHVAVDLDYPYQKIFHPLPPNLGPGVYLGAVERASSFITDELWYGMFAACCTETSVRADGAFIPFSSSMDCGSVTTRIQGVGDVGDLVSINLDAPLADLVGRSVIKVGRSSGLTRGTVIGYGVEYHDDKGLCLFTDLLVVGDSGQEFDMEGDSGSILLLCGETDEKPRPMGMIWGGTSNRGRLKLRHGFEPENWTSGVDLGRLLNLLDLDLISDDLALEDAWKEQQQQYGCESVSGSGDSEAKELGRELEAPRLTTRWAHGSGQSSQHQHRFAPEVREAAIGGGTAGASPVSEEQLVALRLSPGSPKTKRTRMSM